MAIQTVGQLAAVQVLSGGALRLVYKCPVGRKADVNINIANETDTLTSIKIAHIKNDVIANASAGDFLLGGPSTGFPTSALAHNMSPVENNGVLMTAGDEIGVSSTVSNFGAQINGIEEDA